MASQSRKRELPDVARAEDSLEHRSKRRKPNGWFEVLGFETTAEGTVTHQVSFASLRKPCKLSALRIWPACAIRDII